MSSYVCSLIQQKTRTRDDVIGRRSYVSRYSSMSQMPHSLAVSNSCLELDFLNFFKVTLQELEGPHHCWFNTTDEKILTKEGPFMAVCGVFLEEQKQYECGNTFVFERVKMLHQRFPKLNIFGFQLCDSAVSISARICALQTVMKEHIKFPILLTAKVFSQLPVGEGYVIFGSFKGSMSWHEKDAALEAIIKDIEELHVPHNENKVTVQLNESTWTVHREIANEPHDFLYFRNLLLFFPGCISVDEEGKRLFLSDTNHHRIIITDGNGHILDSIGSSPGFQDGDFQSAKLLRPASSIFFADDGCLYFIDSENHALRKADLENRVVVTVHSISSCGESGSIWSLILDKLGLSRNSDSKAEEFSKELFASPWHLIKLGMDLLVINRSFTTSWIMSSIGKVKKVIKGSKGILEICEQAIEGKKKLLEEMLGHGLLRSIDHHYVHSIFLCTDLLSSVANFHNRIIFCDTNGQRILICSRGSSNVSCLRLSNLGVLGLPYWLACPFEEVLNGVKLHGSPKNYFVFNFTVLPGKCDIVVHVKIPEGTRFASHLQSFSVWCQARGAAVEVSGSEAVAKSSEKVGISQQWFDELDNLAFTEPEAKTAQLEQIDDYNFSGSDAKVHLHCAVNVSPGTSEVMVSAAFYLSLSAEKCCNEVEAAEMVLDIPKCNGRREQGMVSSLQLFLNSITSLEDTIFMKSLQLRIKLDCDDYPVTNGMSKDALSTYSTLVANVCLY